MVLAGVALLMWVFPDDTPLEELRDTKPRTAYLALKNAIDKPVATLRHRFYPDLYKENLRGRQVSPWKVELKVYVPNYIDYKSKLHVRATYYGKSVLHEIKEIGTEARGSGPRTFEFPIDVSRQVEARVWLDLYGDGKMVLPLSEEDWSKTVPIRLSVGNPPELDD